MDLASMDPEKAGRDYLNSISTGDFPYTEAHVRHHLEGQSESSFELVLDLILDGLVRLDGSGS